MRDRIQWAGLVLGPVLAAVAFVWLPHEYRNAQGQLVELTSAGRGTLAVLLLMGTWWLTEAIDMSATALVPLAVFPALGIAEMKAAAAPYANPLIFLYLGGILLALSMQRWQLDRRIALLALHCVGPRPAQIVGGFMGVTAVLSAFVSNTATAAMMLPIALRVLRLAADQRVSADASAGTADASAVVAEDRRALSPAAGVGNLGPCLMLGIAYAASIGGISTIVGSPTNLFLVSYLRESIPAPYRTEFSFSKWLLIGVPVTTVYLPIAWWLMTKILLPLEDKPLFAERGLLRRELQHLGRPKPGEWVTFIVFIMTVILWIVRPWLENVAWTRGGATVTPFSGLTDEGISMTAALALFVIPVNVRRRTFVMDWQTAEKVPWGILLLFGGGLSLAKAIEQNGVADFMGAYGDALAGVPRLALVVIVTTFVIFFTEITSNTTTVTTLVPVLVALAPGLSVHPYLLAFPATIGASCAFMLPVATPPNAIVFAAGYVTLPQMVRAGFWLNLVGIVLITVLTLTIIGPLLGV